MKGLCNYECWWHTNFLWTQSFVSTRIKIPSVNSNEPIIHSLRALFKDFLVGNCSILHVCECRKKHTYVYFRNLIWSDAGGCLFLQAEVRLDKNIILLSHKEDKNRSTVGSALISHRFHAWACMRRSLMPHCPLVHVFKPPVNLRFEESDVQVKI